MRQTKKAFLWITDILEKNNIKYKISGGLAAKIYGVKRKLADIDIDVENDKLKFIKKITKPYIKFGPKKYKDKNWNIDLMTIKYKDQEIDISGSEGLIFDKEKKKWQKIESDLNNVNYKKVYGKKVPVEKAASLIKYKLKILRQVDKKDVKILKKLFKIRTP